MVQLDKDSKGSIMKLCRHQCCGNYRSEVIEFKDAQLQFQLLITSQSDNYNKKRIELHTITEYIIKVVQESEIHIYFI